MKKTMLSLVVVALVILSVACTRSATTQTFTPDVVRIVHDDSGFGSSSRTEIVDAISGHADCVTKNVNAYGAFTDTYCRNRAAGSTGSGMMPGGGMMPGYGLGMVTPNTGAVTLYGGYGSKDPAVANAQSVQTTVGMGPGMTPPSPTTADRVKALEKDVVRINRKLHEEKGE